MVSSRRGASAHSSFLKRNTALPWRLLGYICYRNHSTAPIYFKDNRLLVHDMPYADDSYTFAVFTEKNAAGQLPSKTIRAQQLTI